MTFGKTTSFDVAGSDAADDEAAKAPAKKAAAKSAAEAPAEAPAKSKGSKHDFAANEVCTKCGLEKQHLGKSDCSQPDAPAA